MLEKLPDYLYHYTKVDTLELILANRKFRFNSLINMDDMEEAQTSDFDCVGKYLYISSWADDNKQENIALWGLYSNHYEGVRIKMITDPFVHYTAYFNYYEGHTATLVFPQEFLDNNSLYVIPTIPLVRRVEYSENEEKVVQSLQVKAFRNIDGTYNMNANLNDLGRYKRQEWALQKEIRYQFCVLPHNANGNLNIDVNRNHDGLPFDYLDVEISEKGFSSIEVTLGSKMSVENKNRVIAMMHKYFPMDVDKRIRESVLKIK